VQFFYTTLLRASFCGASSLVELLLRRGADANKATAHGWTPLMEATSKNHVRVVQLLLAADANVEATNDVLDMLAEFICSLVD
jgi:ankyrin repeat protein